MRRLRWTTFAIACAGIAMSLSLFLPWYSVRRSAAVGPGVVDGWQAFSHIDLAIVAAGVAALVAPCFLPLPLSRVLSALCGLAGAVLAGWSLVRLPLIPPSVTAAQAPSDFIRAHAAQTGPYAAVLAGLVLATSAAVDAKRGWARPAELSWPSEKTVVAGLVLLAGLVRFSTLSVQSYWYDEFATVEIMRQPHLTQAVHAYMNTESTPPLYYVIAWLWSRLLGTGAFAMRFLSATFGTITVPVAYLAGRRLISGRAGVLAAVLVAVNPTLFWYSQETRAYALMVLMGAVSLLFLARVLDDPTRGNVGLWAISAALALLTHYFAFFLVGAEATVIVWSLRRRLSALVPALIVPPVGLALVPLAHAQGGGSRTNWIAAIPLGHRVAAITKELVSANTLVINENTALPDRGLGYLVAAIIVLSVVAALVVVVRRRRPTGAALPVLVGAAALLIPLLLAGVHEDYLLDRNLLPAWVALAIGLGAALTILPRLVMVGAIVVIGAAGLITDLKIDTDPTQQRSDWRDAVAVLGKRQAPRAIIVIPTYARGLVPYYGVGSSPLGSAGIVTTELDVIGNTNVGGSYPRLGGFLPVVRKQLLGIGLIKLRAGRPALLTPSVARSHGIDPAAIMAEYSIRAGVWLRAYASQLASWQRALTLLDHDATYGSVNHTAVSSLISSEPIDRATLLPQPADIPEAKAWTTLVMVAATHGAQWAKLLGTMRGHPAAAAATLSSAKRFDLALRQVPGDRDGAGRLSATAITSKLLARIS